MIGDTIGMSAPESKAPACIYVGMEACLNLCGYRGLGRTPATRISVARA